jgi:hypothetical protein
MRGAVDLRLERIWGMLLPVLDVLTPDEKVLPLFAEALRVAYVTGYHDADYRGVDAEKDEEIDQQLTDLWAEIDVTIFDEQLQNMLPAFIRSAYRVGANDGETEKPFGPAPQDNPNALWTSEDGG